MGGTEPTVSDANVVLGYLPTFAVVKSGLPALDRDAAVDAVEREIATPLRLDVPSAAAAIRDVVNDTMAGQIRLATIDHGRDPSSFWLVPFGGGGGLHACAMVRKLSLKGALVPVVPGLLSAFGCIMLDARHDCSTSVRAHLDEVSPAELRRMLDAHHAEGEQVLKSQRFEVSEMAHEATFSVRFAGQFHTVDLVTRDLDDLSFERLEGEFKDRYEELYGTLLETRAYLVAVRSSVFARIRPEGEITGLTSSSLETIFDGERTTPVYVDGRQMTVPVWDRAALVPEQELDGPGIIVQPDSTIWVEPGFRASVMGSGVIKLELVGR
jgi:N-methylhydantoinase A